jgi:hypothetical protein
MIMMPYRSPRSSPQLTGLGRLLAPHRPGASRHGGQSSRRRPRAKRAPAQPYMDKRYPELGFGAIMPGYASTAVVVGNRAHQNNSSGPAARVLAWHRLAGLLVTILNGVSAVMVNLTYRWGLRGQAPGGGSYRDGP